MVWYGMSWYGMVWYGMVCWYYLDLLQCKNSDFVIIWFEFAFYGMLWYSMASYGLFILSRFTAMQKFGHIARKKTEL